METLWLGNGLSIYLMSNPLNKLTKLTVVQKKKFTVTQGTAVTFCLHNQMVNAYKSSAIW